MLWRAIWTSRRRGICDPTGRDCRDAILNQRGTRSASSFSDGPRWSALLLLYAVGVAALFHPRVVLTEEPSAARTFGEGWNYRTRTPRWPHWRAVP